MLRGSPLLGWWAASRNVRMALTPTKHDGRAVLFAVVELHVSTCSCMCAYVNNIQLVPLAFLKLSWAKSKQLDALFLPPLTRNRDVVRYVLCDRTEKFPYNSRKPMLFYLLSAKCKIFLHIFWWFFLLEVWQLADKVGNRDWSITSTWPVCGWSHEWLLSCVCCVCQMLCPQSTDIILNPLGDLNADSAVPF